MEQIRNIDFQVVEHLALDCMSHANGLIRQARKQHQADGNTESPANYWTLPLEIQAYCNFLDSSRSARTKLHILVRGDFEPYRHGTLSEATAHFLAERFAHSVWGAIHSVVYADSALRLGQDLGNDGSFQLDSDLVWHNRVEIRDYIRSFEPIDAARYRNIIQVECQKAIHVFASADQHVPNSDDGKRPDEFQYGPLVGSKKDIAKWVLPELGSQDPRGLKTLVDNGSNWYESEGRYSTSVWFHFETQYVNANVRRLRTGNSPTLK